MESDERSAGIKLAAQADDVRVSIILIGLMFRFLGLQSRPCLTRFTVLSIPDSHGPIIALL